MPRVATCFRPVLGLLTLLLLVAPTEASDVTFFSERTRVPAGTTSTLPFQVTASADEDRSFEVSVEPSGRLEIVREAQVLRGERVGYLRVRGITPGRVDLHIGGRALQVDVVPPRNEEPRKPAFVTPAPDAMVWGPFSVGALVDSEATDVALLLPDGSSLEPEGAGTRERGPLAHLHFIVPEDRLPRGPVELRVRCRLGDRVLESEPRRILKITVAGTTAAETTASETTQGQLLKGECEEARHERPYPDRYGENAPLVVRDGAGAIAVANYSAFPAVSLPVEVAEPGLYQLMMRVRGDFAGGAFPSIALFVNNEEESRTGAQLVTSGWQRIPVGRPVRLEAGTQHLTPYFSNDFFAPQLCDRNLFLDRYELARVPSVAATSGDTATSRPASRPRAPGRIENAIAHVASEYWHDPASFTIAFTRPFDGETLPGRVVVKGIARWDGKSGTVAPHVTLLVNDQPIAEQTAPDPVFWVDASNFTAGTNTLQLVARLDSGETTKSRVHTAQFAADVSSPEPRPHVDRYHVLHSRWKHDADRLRGSGPEGHRVAGYYAASSSVLELPKELTGEFEIHLEGRGDNFQGPPIAAVEHVVGDTRTPVGEIRFWGWDTRGVGRVRLDPGPKALEVRFTNDHFEANVGDRNLFIRALILAEVDERRDDLPPHVIAEYPEDGHEVVGVDAVVVTASDNREVRSVSLFVDGEEVGVRTGRLDREGRVLLPLLTRGLAPGTHEWVVRATDAAGHVSESVRRRFIIREKVVEGDMRETPYGRAVRLANRLGYGPDPHTLAAILAEGEQRWLDRVLSASAEENEARHTELAHIAETLLPNVQSTGHIMQRALFELLATREPVNARFVQWTQNHFSTWINKTQPGPKWGEHRAFSRQGIAPFRDLLHTSAESPAMMHYLDQVASFSNRLNENYAREILELHTVGVDGGYDQTDVTELAHLLTGCTAADEAPPTGVGRFQMRRYRFDSRLSDRDDRTVLGYRFVSVSTAERHDRVDNLRELLVAHPSTARFVATKLASHYVSTPPPAELIDDLATVYLETGGDSAELLRTIATHPEFFAAPDRLATPIDFALRVARAVESHRYGTIIGFLNRSGMPLFGRATPDGYPDDGESYADSNAMLQRWQLGRQSQWALWGALPDPLRRPPRGEAAVAEWRERVIDWGAVRLTGYPLSKTSHEAALSVFEAAEGAPRTQVLNVLAFLVQLPEVNLR